MKSQEYLNQMLLRAAEHDDLHGVKSFVALGALVDCPDGDGWTPLHWAASNGNLNAAITLLDKGASVHAKSKYGTTPFMAASFSGQVDLLRRLVDAGAKVEEKDSEGWTPLLLAVHGGSAEATRFLLDQGADLDALTHHDYGVDCMVEKYAKEEKFPQLVDLIRAERARRALQEDDAPSGCEEPTA